MAHARLSIIDISSGIQPMCNEDKKIWVVFNGEIYNHSQLRNLLTKKGHIFKTHHSDTEVILHAYEEWGENCLSKFNGMFAFVIFDYNQDTLFIARDRLGQKPLYYYFQEDIFVFASEIKSLREIKNLKLDLDYQSLGEFLTYGNIPYPNSIYKYVKKLPPASLMWVSLRDRKINIKRDKYWSLEYAPDYSKTEENWLEELEALLIDSIRLRMIADVPLGVFFSGGVDSPLITALMRKQLKASVKTFTIGFKEKKYDESEDALLMSKYLGTEHYSKTVTPSVIGILDELLLKYDEPFADSSALPTFLVSKFAREKVKVVLTGDGGDEAFLGYNRYSVNYLYEKYFPLTFKIMASLIYKIYPYGFIGKDFLKVISQRTFKDSYKHSIYDCNLSGVLHEDIIYEINKNKRKDIFSLLCDKFNYSNLLAEVSLVDTFSYLTDDILQKVDRATMFNSLEARSPFLDYRIYEFSSKIPIEIRFKNNTKKYLLKKILEKYLPISYIYNKPKRGFRIPINKWFGSDKRWKEEIIALKSCKFFNKKALRQIHFLSWRNKSIADRIWKLVVLKKWLSNYF